MDNIPVISNNSIVNSIKKGVIYNMKATGIVRRIDDLGRVVIPKEIRRTMRIHEGDPLEIFTSKDGEVIFKKYSAVGDLANFATEYAEALCKISGLSAAITDKDVIISVSGTGKKELMEKKVSDSLENIMNSRTPLTSKSDRIEKVLISDSVDKYFCFVAIPIISEGDAIGSVILYGNEETTVTETEDKLATTAATVLGKIFEN